jgi:hypothetical protein
MDVPASYLTDDIQNVAPSSNWREGNDVLAKYPIQSNQSDSVVKKYKPSHRYYFAQILGINKNGTYVVKYKIPPRLLRRRNVLGVQFNASNWDLNKTTTYYDRPTGLTESNYTSSNTLAIPITPIGQTPNMITDKKQTNVLAFNGWTTRVLRNGMPDPAGQTFEDREFCPDWDMSSVSDFSGLMSRNAVNPLTKQSYVIYTLYGNFVPDADVNKTECPVNYL